MGSLGEAVHLVSSFFPAGEQMLTSQSFDERVRIIRFIRRTLDEEGMSSTPIVAGVGGSSTRETISLARAAANAGAYVVAFRQWVLSDDQASAMRAWSSFRHTMRRV